MQTTLRFYPLNATTELSLAMYLRIAKSSLVAFLSSRAASITPRQLQVIHVPCVEYSVVSHSRNDLKAGQIAEIRTEFDMHQLAIRQGGARWLIKCLAGVEDRVLEVFLVDKTVDSDLAVSWPRIGTSNICGECINPKHGVCES